MRKKVWHPYTEWEDYRAGMWRILPRGEVNEMLEKAIVFTGDCELYGSYMRRVIVEWPVSTEHNLTDAGINRRAWVGHAAACMAIESPEYITRRAWGFLNDEQRARANAQADGTIQIYEDRDTGARLI